MAAHGGSGVPGLAIAGAALALMGAGIAVAVGELAGRAGGAVAVAVGVALVIVGMRGAVGASPGQVDLTDARVRAEDAEAQLALVLAQAERLVAGDVLTAPPEAGAVIAGLHRVRTKMDEMINARAHIVATERDLDHARRMYRQILPLSSAMEHNGLCVAGSSTPAAETGGDWWTYRKVAGGVVLVIGDATGHGVHSAMVGCAAHGAVKGIATLGEHTLTPRKMLDAVHAAIRIPGMDRAAMTLFTAQLDPTAMQLHYMNDGHVFPLIARRDADGTITDVASIMGDRGEELSEDSTDFAVRQGSHALEPGQVLVFFTDGLIERAGKDGRPFGQRRLSQALVGASVPHTLVALQALRDRLLSKVAEFAGDAPLEDDVTLVLCSLAPAAAAQA